MLPDGTKQKLVYFSEALAKTFYVFLLHKIPEATLLPRAKISCEMKSDHVLEIIKPTKRQKVILHAVITQTRYG